jgi:hypothetical protein
MKKRLLTAFLTAILLVTFNQTAIFAATEAYYDITDGKANAAEEEKVKQIELLLDELGSINAAILFSKNQLSDLARQTSPQETRSLQAEIEESITVNRQKYSELEESLLSLGLKKLDYDDTDDLEKLCVLFTNSDLLDESDEGSFNAPLRSPPDFTSIKNFYTVFEYSGQYTIQGVKYSYMYFRVLADQSTPQGNKLYAKTDESLIKTSVTLQVFKSLISSGFSLAVEAVLVSTGVGAPLAWGLSTVFTEFVGMAINSISSQSNKNIYRAIYQSYSDMTYYFMDYGGWVMSGINAPIVHCQLQHVFEGVVNGYYNVYSPTASQFKIYLGYDVFTKYLTHFVEINGTWVVDLGPGYFKVAGNGLTLKHYYKYVTTPVHLLS